MKKRLLLTLFLMVSVLAFGQKLPFQGKLIEAGTPVNDTRTFVFEIASVGWSESHADVTITDGLYFVVLGSINPLPDSLFYGADEQSMAITVGGVALSPVTLFKPLSAPFEGDELVVHNDEGTIVGEMRALSLGDNKNGEVSVFGTNGSKNITLRGYSHWQTPGNNFGWLDVSNDEGIPKVSLLVTPYRGVNGSGEFHLFGETSSGIHQGFNNYDGMWDYPSLQMQSADGGSVNIDITKSDTVEFGQLSLTSGNNEEMYLSPNRLTTKRNGTELAALSTQDWGGQGESGFISVNGPSGMPNIEMTSKSWENAELPWLKMVGTGWNDIVQISASNDSTESGYMNLFSVDNKEASFYATGIRFNTTGDNGSELVSINIENRDDSGYAGYFNLNGPNTGNIGMGSRHWEGKADLPLINLYGENYFHGMEISIIPDGSGDQYGFINLMSENGKSLHLSPEGFGVDKISLNTVNENGGSSGEIYLWGENGSPNIQMGGKPWENHDLGHFAVFTDKPDGNGWYYGAAGIVANSDGTNSWGMMSLYNNGEERISLDGQNGSVHGIAQDGKRGILAPDELLLTRANWSAVASIRNAGDYGEMNLYGPASTNVSIGGQANTDLPWISLKGTDDFEVMQIGAIDDATQRGFIKMVNRQSGEEMYYSSHGVEGNNPFQISGGLNVNGFIILNGDTIHADVSDRRYKTNIQLLGDDVLTKVEQVRGVSYDWRKDEFPEKHFTNAKQIGVIAQELEAQFPELVTTNTDGYKSVNYSGFTAVLLEAVKELNAKVEKLETENTQLEAELSASVANNTEIEQLKAQMESLVKIVQGQNSTALEESTSTSGLK